MAKTKKDVSPPADPQDSTTGTESQLIPERLLTDKLSALLRKNTGILTATMIVVGVAIFFFAMMDSDQSVENATSNSAQMVKTTDQESGGASPKKSPVEQSTAGPLTEPDLPAEEPSSGQTANISEPEVAANSKPADEAIDEGGDSPAAVDGDSVFRPSARPQSAPVVTVFEKSGAWYDKALTGLEPPYPASLKFLESQGAWYTPFTRPGMTGPYDLRNFHQP